MFVKESEYSVPINSQIILVNILGNILLNIFLYTNTHPYRHFIKFMLFFKVSFKPAFSLNILSSFFSVSLYRFIETKDLRVLVRVH